MIGKRARKQICKGPLKNFIIQGIPDGVAYINSCLSSLDVIIDAGSTLLHLAVKRGEKDVIKLAIDSGCDINFKDRFGTTPLLTSILYNQFDIAKLLLEANAEIDATNLSGKSALSVVLNVKRKVPNEVIRYFYDSLKRNGDSSEEIARKFLAAGSSLVSAVYMNDAQMTRAILERKKSIDDEESRRSVRAAMQYGMLENVRVLLQYGPDMSTRKLAFNDELYSNLENLRPNIDFGKPFVDRMIDWGIIDAAYVKFFENIFERTKHEVVQLFLDNKIDAHVKENFGIDLFLYLGGNANPGIVKLLQSRKFDVNARNSKGKSALHLAVSNYAIENIRYLLDEGADPNAKDINGATPLHASCESLCVDLLLRAGADVQATDAIGRTVFGVPSYEKVLDLMLVHLTIVEGRGTLIKKEVRYAIQSRDPLKTTYESLRDQIEELKKHKVFRSINLFTILLQKPENIANSLRSRNVLSTNLNYIKDRQSQWNGYYASTMISHLERALEIVDLREKAASTVQKCVSHLVQLNCDHLALETIVRFLSYQDLLAFA